MTPSQKSLVQQTFAQVVPIADQAAALFYGRLFELDPSLRSLFKNDIRAQGQKLMQMLGYAVGKLDAPDELAPAVEGLGRKHVGVRRQGRGLRHRRRRLALDTREGPGAGVHDRRQGRLDRRLRGARRHDDEGRRRVAA